MAREFDFHYTPLEGKLPGLKFQKQTEDAINDIGQRVVDIQDDAETAIETAETAMETAQEAKDIADGLETAIDNAQQSADNANTSIVTINNTLTEISWTQDFTDIDGVLYQKVSGEDVEEGEDTEELKQVANRYGQSMIANAINSLNTRLLAERLVSCTNVAQMIATDIPAGAYVETKGYYAVNDGGNARYSIRVSISGETYDNGSLILLDNGNVAELITDGTMNVRQFGAKGDGVTDDTARIQAALTFGKTVLFDEGTYFVTSALSKNSNVVLKGNNATLKNATDFEVLTISNANEVAVEDLAFEGVTPTTSGNPGYHTLTLSGCSNFVVKNNKFHDVNMESAVYIDTCMDGIVELNEIDNYAFSGIIIYNESERIIVKGNTVVNNVNTVQAYGIQSNCSADRKYPNDIKIIYNYIKKVHSWDGIMSHGGNNIEITGNICEDVRCGIDCSGSRKNANSVQKNYIIKGNTLIASTDTSITASNINAGIIFGFDNTLQSDGCIISDNIIKGYKIGTSENVGGLKIQNANNVTVCNNDVSDALYGISLKCAYGISMSINIFGNNIHDLVANPFKVLNGIFKGLTITNNICMNKTPSVFWLITFGTTLTAFIDSYECLNKTNFTRTPSSSSYRSAFHFEYLSALSLGQQLCVYNRGDKIYGENPVGYIGWVATNTGINATTEWSASTSVTRGAMLYYGTNAYVVITSGTTGSTAPTDVTGVAFEDGTAELMYVGDKTITFKLFGAMEA